MANTTRPCPRWTCCAGFESAARHLCFTRAAAELFLTQSAVSRQIQALEEFLGVPLFERRHKALALTEAGRRTTAPSAARSTSCARPRASCAKRAPARAHRDHHGLVRLDVAGAALARFRKAHPRIDVRITATHEVVDIEREGIDLAIRDCRSTPCRPGDLLVGEHWPRSAARATRRRRRRRSAARQPEDLRHHVLLNCTIRTGAGRGSRGRRGWRRAASRTHARRPLSFDQYDQVIQAALHGQGVALGRMTLARAVPRDKRLVRSSAAAARRARVPRGVRAGRASATEARQFVEWVQREIRKDQ
jgi:DNA-binding transcriptional LysR family regulator